MTTRTGQQNQILIHIWSRKCGMESGNALSDWVYDYQLNKWYGIESEIIKQF